MCVAIETEKDAAVLMRELTPHGPNAYSRMVLRSIQRREGWLLHWDVGTCRPPVVAAKSAVKAAMNDNSDVGAKVMWRELLAA